MAQASKAKRRLRKIKRERTIAFNIAANALAQRDYARDVLYRLNLAIEQKEREAHEQANQTDRQDENSAGLEVPTV